MCANADGNAVAGAAIPSPSIGTTRKTIQNEENKIFDQAQQMQIEKDPILDLEGYSRGTANQIGHPSKSGSLRLREMLI